MKPAPRPKALAWKVFRGSAALDHGHLTPSQLRSSSWLHLGYGLYADSRLDQDHELKCRGVQLRLPEHAYIAGPSAAYLYGVEHAAIFDDLVHIVVPASAGFSQGQLTKVHRVLLEPDDVAVRRGLAVTTPARTAWDLARWLKPPQAVAIVDSLLSLGWLRGDDLDRVLQGRAGRNGYRRAALVFDLADGRAQSPAESHTRVRLVLGGIPRPEVQHPIQVRGRTLHPDLAWPRWKVALEYDGAWHGGRDQLHVDRKRLNLLVSAGWIVLHVTGRRMRYEFPQVVQEVKAALRSRGWQPGDTA